MSNQDWSIVLAGVPRFLGESVFLPGRTENTPGVRSLSDRVEEPFPDSVALILRISVAPTYDDSGTRWVLWGMLTAVRFKTREGTFETVSFITPVL